MDSLSFVYWLQGFLELQPNLKSIDENQINIIREHIKIVFHNKRISDNSKQEFKKLSEINIPKNFKIEERPDGIVIVSPTSVMFPEGTTLSATTGTGPFIISSCTNTDMNERITINPSPLDINVSYSKITGFTNNVNEPKYDEIYRRSITGLTNNEIINWDHHVNPKYYAGIDVGKENTDLNDVSIFTVHNEEDLLFKPLIERYSIKKLC